MPSEGEGQSLAQVQHQAQGGPMIAGDTLGAREPTAEGDKALLYEPRKPERILREVAIVGERTGGRCPNRQTRAEAGDATSYGREDTERVM